MGNILLRLPSTLDQLSEQQLYDQFYPPDPEPVSRADGKPLALGVPSHGLLSSLAWLRERKSSAL